jgi:hypothetical protein
MENQDSTYGALSDVAAQVPLKEASAPPTVSPKPREVPPAPAVEQPAGFAGITPVNEFLVGGFAYYTQFLPPDGTETVDISGFVPASAKVAILEFYVYGDADGGGYPTPHFCDVDVDGEWWAVYEYELPADNSYNFKIQFVAPINPARNIRFRAWGRPDYFSMTLRGYM